MGDFASQQQVYTKKEVSAEDVEASRQAYEMKKKQQAEQKAQSLKQSSSTTSTSSSQQSTVTMREKKTTEETQSAMSDKRRSSISSALLMDPAQAHAQAGIIDPSAILRGEQLSPWATTTHTAPPPKTSLRDVTAPLHPLSQFNA